MRKTPYSPGTMTAWEIAVAETTEAAMMRIGCEQFLCGLLKLTEAADYLQRSGGLSRSEMEILHWEAGQVESLFSDLGVKRAKPCSTAPTSP